MAGQDRTSDLRRLPPDRVRLVHVLADDGRWCPGKLLASTARDGVWSGWVHLTAGVSALTYVGWFPEHRLRRVEPGPVAGTVA